MSDLTFFSKTPLSCPVCETRFYREELRTGRGRLNAGELTKELRRTYLPSQKYGEVFPLIYPVTVCPGCYYATYHPDFLELPEESLEPIRAAEHNRINDVQRLFEGVDFTSPRRLQEGCSSYYLAATCYEHFDRAVSPVFKQGLSSLRAAWLCNDLHRKRPNDNFDYLAQVFYRKARFFYTYAVELEQKGQHQDGPQMNRTLHQGRQGGDAGGVQLIETQADRDDQDDLGGRGDQKGIAVSVPHGIRFSHGNQFRS